MYNGQHIRMKNLCIYVYTVYMYMYVVVHIYICSYILPYLRLCVCVYTYKHVYTQIRKNIRRHMCMRNLQYICTVQILHMFVQHPSYIRLYVYSSLFVFIRIFSPYIFNICFPYTFVHMYIH